jgi:exodeoxyribonuclease VII large subunit
MPGLQILVEVTVNFHEVYGFSCVIRDIDPTFTLGDLAQKRQETIRRLKEDGVWEMNKTLELPKPANRIAVISSASAAGYGDFLNQLETNKKGYKFQTELFPAIMQGDESAASIIEALDAVYAAAERFDAVVMIRGGGASADMLAFDEYELATHCAQFPLPIITGIGHDRDESIVDMVAHTRSKTPTAAAAFLIDEMAELENHLLRLQTNVFGKTTNYLKEEEKRLRNFTLLFSQQCHLRLQKERFQLVQRKERIQQKTNFYLNQQKNRLDLFAKTITLVSPQNILKKGYTLTVKAGKNVRSAGELKAGELITTIFADGKKQSIIK